MDEPYTCTLCESGEYVLYDNDKVCPECGYVSGSKPSEGKQHGPWERWRRIRNELFEKGQNDRRKVVGSYAFAYFDESGNIVI